VLLADVNLGDILWSMFVFFCFFIWIMILFQVFGDLFRDTEESGAKKVLWVIFVIIAPFLGVFIYLLVRGQGMAKRQMAAATQAQQDFNNYVQQVAGSGGSPTEQIAKAKELLDAGAIDQGEFDAIKAKALA
jgi:hypothetical protein